MFLFSFLAYFQTSLQGVTLTDTVLSSSLLCWMVAENYQEFYGT